MKKTQLFVLLFSFAAVTYSQPIIHTQPETPYRTHEHLSQNVEFDFIITGNKGGKYHLKKIQLRIYDQDGKLLQRKKIEDEGMVSGLYEFPVTTVKKDKSISLFNPFYQFPSQLLLHRLEYQFTFFRGDQSWEVTKVITPTAYVQKTQLMVPLKGRMIIDSGYDHYAHHRRMNTTHWGMKLLKISNNITRYASDWAHADEHGAIYQGDGKELKDYFGFGQSVYAPAKGKVIEVVNHLPDNAVAGKLAYGTIAFIKNPKLASGNYVVIDHQNGEMSLLAHFKQGSVRVKPGQQVSAGDLIAELGNSGDSTYPHLHYQLENEHGRNTLTYPAKFMGIQSLNGIEINQEAVYCNTGDMIFSQ